MVYWNSTSTWLSLTVSPAETLIDLITSIRNQKTEANKPLQSPINLSIYLKDSNLEKYFKELDSYIKYFTKAHTLTYLNKPESNNTLVVVVLNELIYYIPQSDLIDLAKVKENLLNEKEKLTKELERSHKMLGNPSFISKAPESKVLAEKKKLKDYEDRYNEVIKHLEELN